MRKGNALYYLFLPFFVVYIIFILTPVIRILTFQSFTYLVGSGTSGIWKSIYYTYLLALVVGLVSVGFSIPYVYFTSRNGSKTVKALDSLVELPIMIPHTVVGVMMLILLEPSMPLGSFIARIIPGYQFDDTFFAVIVTLLFLSSAYTIRSVQLAYARDTMKFENMARTLGLSASRSFFIVAIPIMWKSILRGLVLTWARSISEVGSLLIVAYYIFPSLVQLAGVYIYSQINSGGLSPAVASSSILILSGIVTLFAVKLLESGNDRIR